MLDLARKELYNRNTKHFHSNHFHKGETIMEETRKECRKCERYQAYYTKGLARFNKEKRGFCRASHAVVENHDCCENWCFRSSYGSRRKVDMTKALAELIEQLSGIKQILQEENEHEKQQR